MKKLLAVGLLLCMLMPCAVAEDIDLSVLTYDELVVLRDRCLAEMQLRDEWKEVTVPIGVYEVGKDIPAAHWTITAAPSEYGWGSITYCDALDGSGKNVDIVKSHFYYSQQIKVKGSGAYVEATSIDLNAVNPGYIIIEYGPMVFTPYTGAPDLGFK